MGTDLVWVQRVGHLLVGGFLLAGCAGEVTTLDFGSSEETFARYKEEVQPVLEQEALTPVFRNCAAGGCHGDNAGNLQIVASPTEDELIENFRQVQKFVNAADPDESPLLKAPLTGEGHPVTCFTGEDDCCYQIVRAFVADEAAPECECPGE